MLIYGLNPVLEALRAKRVRRLKVSARGDRRMDEASGWRVVACTRGSWRM
jgi:hypothetical protein